MKRKREIAFKTLAKYCKSYEYYTHDSGHQNVCNDGRHLGVCCAKYCPAWKRLKEPQG